jgi:sugar O-acyltransferase (sialic acid O-acetyltransferase NeuD family)
MVDDGVLVGLFGSGGFGREVMPLLRLAASGAEIVFVDPAGRPGPLNGHRVIGEAEFFADPRSAKFANVAIGAGRLRARVHERALAHGARPISIVSPTASVFDCNEIGPAAIVCHHAVITANVRIGRGFHCNLGAYVAHDCVIGDFVTFAPGVKCNGNVEIGDYAYIGTGAMLRHGTPGRPLRIGRGATVGMGAIVVADVPDGATVAGNPARPLIPRDRPPTQTTF